MTSSVPVRRGLGAVLSGDRRPCRLVKARRFRAPEWGACAACPPVAVRAQPVPSLAIRVGGDPGVQRAILRGANRGGTHDDHHHPADHQQRRAIARGGGATNRGAAPGAMTPPAAALRGLALGDDAHHDAAMERQGGTSDGKALAVAVRPNRGYLRPSGFLALAGDDKDAVSRLGGGVLGGVGHDLLLFGSAAGPSSGFMRARQDGPSSRRSHPAMRL